MTNTKDEEHSWNFFKRCAETRIKVNEICERSDELLERSREIIGMSQEEWDEMMSTPIGVNGVNKTKVMKEYAKKKGLRVHKIDLS